MIRDHLEQLLVPYLSALVYRTYEQQEAEMAYIQTFLRYPPWVRL